MAQVRWFNTIKPLWDILADSYLIVNGAIKQDAAITYGNGNTQPVWTLFLFKSIWTCSQGSRGVKKSDFFFTNKIVEFLR